MLIIAGTVPVPELELITGPVSIAGDALTIDGQKISCTQGTAAMIGAALATTDYLKLEPPVALLAGDVGQGKGSRLIYEYLIDNISGLNPEVLALHYWLPDMSLTRRLCRAVDALSNRPIMIADAASMYSAKGAGLGASFDIFTPDASEIAFLADPEATHPAYINRHLFDTDETQAPQLALEAYKNRGAAKLLLVKGSIDYIIQEGELLATVDEPDVPALEAIGGTGDTITGLVAALVYTGLQPHEAAVIAARANRVAGKLANATPATKVSEVIAQFPEVFRKNLCQWTGVCYNTGGNTL